ncbi:hypothetical protein LA080_012817 [Diaporthe eres]|nr:hypothetical protein LA080_012817 [Diaporthe eres]
MLVVIVHPPADGPEAQRHRGTEAQRPRRPTGAGGTETQEAQKPRRPRVTGGTRGTEAQEAQRRRRLQTGAIAGGAEFKISVGDIEKLGRGEQAYWPCFLVGLCTTNTTNTTIATPSSWATFKPNTSPPPPENKFVIISRTHKDCKKKPKHISKYTDYPINDRCNHKDAGTSKCPNLAASTTQVLGATPKKGPCPLC